MCSQTLALPATTMTTSWEQHEKHDAEVHPLRMIWVMVNERHGNRRPYMFWRIDY